MDFEFCFWILCFVSCVLCLVSCLVSCVCNLCIVLKTLNFEMCFLILYIFVYFLLFMSISSYLRKYFFTLILSCFLILYIFVYFLLFMSGNWLNFVSCLHLLTYVSIFHSYFELPWGLRHTCLNFVLNCIQIFSIWSYFLFFFNSLSTFCLGTVLSCLIRVLFNMLCRQFCP